MKRVRDEEGDSDEAQHDNKKILQKRVTPNFDGIPLDAESIVIMNPFRTRWLMMRYAETTLVKSFIEKYPKVLTTNDQNRITLTDELQNEILEAVMKGVSIDDLNRTLPNMRMKEVFEDLVLKIYAQYLEPFLLSPEQACTNLPLMEMPCQKTNIFAGSMQMKATPKINNDVDTVVDQEAHSKLVRLLKWMTVIRSYGFHLTRLVNRQLNSGLPICKQVQNISPMNDQQNKTEQLSQSTMTEIIEALEKERYKILRPNSRSDKKVVTLCAFNGSLRVFAVKIFGVKYAGQYLHEVEVMKLLGKHPHIGEFLATATLDIGPSIIIQPYYHDYDRNLCFKDYCKVFLQLAKGLAHIHEQGVIHGDIKPSNIILCVGPHVRIIDFDSSLRIGINGREKYAGTPGFRAPELKDKEHQITPMIDIWGLAMTITAGIAVPDETDSLKKRQNIFDHLNDSKGFFYPFKNLLVQMLDLVPENRPTASQVQAAIELIMQGKE